MAYQGKPKAVVILQDGSVFWGRATGLNGTATGEICFNTGMTGYQEIFTDPSYFGQIMVTTMAHVGNYGVNEQEVESDTIKINGLICRNFSVKPSRYAPGDSLYNYFQEQNKVLISDVDTRALVRHIRDKGAMNAIISTDVDNLPALHERLQTTPSMEGLQLSDQVSTPEAYYYGSESAPYRIAVLDLGVKRNILRNFAARDCYLKVFPMHASVKEMLAWNPHGLFISNGPGDPAAMQDSIAKTREMIETGLPLFGICLGHQLLALSQNIATEKMHAGHRGVNHPIKNEQTGKGEITTQNHGFVVNGASLENNPNVELTHRHLNDGTVAGFRFKNQPVMGIQYHPEAFPGPHDSYYLFDDFVKTLNP